MHNDKKVTHPRSSRQAAAAATDDDEKLVVPRGEQERLRPSPLFVARPRPPPAGGGS